MTYAVRIWFKRQGYRTLPLIPETRQGALWEIARLRSRGIDARLVELVG